MARTAEFNSACISKLQRVSFLILCGGFILEVLMIGPCLENYLTHSTYYVTLNTTPFLPFGQTQWKRESVSNRTNSIASCADNTNLVSDYRGFIYNNVTGLCTHVFGVAPVGTNGAGDVDDEQEMLYLDVKLECPQGFQLYRCDEEVSCLRKSSLQASYTEATDLCNSWGSHLVEVKTVPKLELVRDVAPGLEVWTGLDSLAADGALKYQSDGSVLTWEQRHAVFGPGEPNNGAGSCAHISLISLMLNDHHCDDIFSFVCEIYIIK